MRKKRRKEDERLLIENFKYFWVQQEWKSENLEFIFHRNIKLFFFFFKVDQKMEGFAISFLEKIKIITEGDERKKENKEEDTI